METPLYEYDQVITCQDIVAVIEQLLILYQSCPKWRFIERFKIRIQILTVDELHKALHLKSYQIKKTQEDTLQ